MKEFIIKTSIPSIFILILLVSVNYWGDSAKIFHPNYENKIAEIIFNNSHATNISNFNERILQKELIQKLISSPDIVILGSSRTMLINSTYYENKKVINSSVSGASIQDLIAIFQMYSTKNRLPKKIILGVDPWLFNENNGQIRWQSLRKEYASFENQKIEENDDLLNNKVKQLFSLSYFQASFINLPAVIVGKSDPIATEEIYNHSNTILVDASLSYSKKYREASNEEVNSAARIYSSGGIYSIENFKNISPQIFSEFEQLCIEILKNDIELSFFLAPYHPIVYKKIEQEYHIVLETENKLREFSKKRNIECLGSFNPATYGIESAGFYDGMHSKENTIKKILKVETRNNAYKSLGHW